MTEIKQFFNSIRREISIAKTKRALVLLDRRMQIYIRELNSNNLAPNVIKQDAMKQYSKLKKLIIKFSKKLL